MGHLLGLCNKRRKEMRKIELTHQRDKIESVGEKMVSRNNYLSTILLTFSYQSCEYQQLNLQRHGQLLKVKAVIFLAKSNHGIFLVRVAFWIGPILSCRARLAWLDKR